MALKTKWLTFRTDSQFTRNARVQLNHCGWRWVIQMTLRKSSVSNIYFVIAQGAGHNDVEMYTQYLERLKQFVSVELINWQQLQSDTSAHEAASGMVTTCNSIHEHTHNFCSVNSFHFFFIIFIKNGFAGDDILNASITMSSTNSHNSTTDKLL